MKSTVLLAAIAAIIGLCYQKEVYNSTVVLQLHPCQSGTFLEQGWNLCDTTTGDCKCDRKCFFTHMGGPCNSSYLTDENTRCKLHNSSKVWFLHPSIGAPTIKLVHNLFGQTCLNHTVEFLPK